MGVVIQVEACNKVTDPGVGLNFRWRWLVLYLYLYNTTVLIRVTGGRRVPAAGGRYNTV
jgi:hypothetical protein